MPVPSSGTVARGFVSGPGEVSATVKSSGRPWAQAHCAILSRKANWCCVSGSLGGCGWTDSSVLSLLLPVTSSLRALLTSACPLAFNHIARER